LPDALTLSRVPMAGALWLVADSLWALLAVMAAAAMSDALDGFLARKLGVFRGHGAWLDPACDKAFIVSLAALLVARGYAPWWYVALMASREILQLPLMLALLAFGRRGVGRFDFRASVAGKAATGAQFLALLAIVFRIEALALVIIAAVLGLGATVQYAQRAGRASAP
jgi:phosphatidylglycerophosphate synthase